MAKQLPALNEITSALSNDDLMLVRDVQSGVDYKAKVSTIKNFIAPKSVQVYDTTAAMVADTDLVDGDRVRTFGDSSIGDGGAYLYEINTTEGVALNNGLFAKRTAEQKIGTPKDFGAVGDGVTDDTIEVQAAVDNLDICYIETTYSVTEITIPETCYVTTNGDSWIKYGGSTPGDTVVTLNAAQTGILRVDGNNQRVRLVHAPEGITYEQRAEHISYKNTDIQSGDPTTISGINLASDRFILNSASGENLTNGGATNDSLPSGIVTNGGTYIIGSHYLKDGRAGFVAQGRKSGQDINTATGNVTVQSNWTDNCEDNSCYLLAGEVTIGQNIANGIEESVQINAVKRADIGRIVAIGRTLGAYNLQNTIGPVSIGEIVGMVPDGLDESEWGENCPTLIGYNRSGNVDLGSQELYIGSVRGIFQRAFNHGGTGTNSRIVIDDVDVDLQYNPENNPVNSWTGPNTDWLDFADVEELYIKNARFRIRNRDVASFSTGTDFSWTRRAVGTIKGHVENLEVYFYENDGTEDQTVVLRGPVPTQDFHIDGMPFVNIGGNTYSTNMANGSYIKDSINGSAPQEGYWYKGRKLINRNFEYEVDDEESFHNMSTGSVGSGANWQSVRGLAPQLSDSVAPGVGLVPQTRGQHFIETGTSPNTVWYGYALSAGSWIKLNNEP